MERFESIARTLEQGDHGAVREHVLAALQAGVDAHDILNRGLLAGMQVVGTRFRAHEIFLPDVLLAARAMYAGLDPLEGLLGEQGAQGRGTIVLGTVAGDQHDIGKSLVKIMLEGAGVQVVDLGVDVPAAQFVDAAVEHGAEVIGLSALLTTTMPVMGEVTAEVRRRGLSERLRVVVGGAPVNEEFAQEIGADAVGWDAAGAVDLVTELVREVEDARSSATP